MVGSSPRHVAASFAHVSGVPPPHLARARDTMASSGGLYSFSFASTTSQNYASSSPVGGVDSSVKAHSRAAAS